MNISYKWASRWSRLKKKLLFSACGTNFNIFPYGNFMYFRNETAKLVSFNNHIYSLGVCFVLRFKSHMLIYCFQVITWQRLRTITKIMRIMKIPKHVQLEDGRVGIKFKCSTLVSTQLYDLAIVKNAWL